MTTALRGPTLKLLALRLLRPLRLVGALRLMGPLRLPGPFCPFRLLRAPQIAGAPRIAGGLSDGWVPFRLLRAPQIAGGPSDCWWALRWLGPFRLLRAPHIVGAPQIDEAPQIAWGPSDCWGPLRLPGPLGLLGAPQMVGGLSDSWGRLRLPGAPQIAGGPCALHNLHNPLLRHCGIGLWLGPKKDHGRGSWILVKWPSYSGHWTEHLHSQNCKWPKVSSWTSWRVKKVLVSKNAPPSPAPGDRCPPCPPRCATGHLSILLISFHFEFCKSVNLCLHCDMCVSLFFYLYFMLSWSRILYNLFLSFILFYFVSTNFGE